MYSVYNESYVRVNVSDEDIENSIKENSPLKLEIINAMGRSHKREYLEYLYPYLDDEVLYRRTATIQSIINIDGKVGLDKLKEREAKLDQSDYDTLPSEKALLNAAIIYFEKGISRAEDYFFSEDGINIIKEYQLEIYGAGFQYTEADIAFMLRLINSFVDKEFDWMKDMSKTDYMETLCFYIEYLWIAYRDTNVFSCIDDSVNEIFCVLVEKISDMSKNSNLLEYIAEITKGMKEEYAIRVLATIKDKVRGDAKKEYKKAIKHWGIEE